jgi:hypothetical protein
MSQFPIRRLLWHAKVIEHLAIKLAFYSPLNNHFRLWPRYCQSLS